MLSASGGCANLSCLMLDRPRVRGAVGECAQAGKSGAAKEQKISLSQLPKSPSHGRGCKFCEKYERTWDVRDRRFESKENRNSEGKDPRTFDGNSLGP